jgi:hypothetical protein
MRRPILTIGQIATGKVTKIVLLLVSVAVLAGLRDKWISGPS